MASRLQKTDSAIGCDMRHRFHAICPYFAMFPESFVRRYLVWATPGGFVFDPFSGRGTTVFESLLNHKKAAGCDVNPVAACVSNAKVDPPTAQQVLERLNELQKDAPRRNPEVGRLPFFRACFHPETLKEIVHLRSQLLWRDRKEDRFIAAVLLGCLHGESHRSGRYFSNRMPRTISTKPDYSVRWWLNHNSNPPPRSVFQILRQQIEYRFVSEPAPLRARVAETDARHSSRAFPELKRRVSLIVTSPPYLDTTNFREDQWLRLWFLGGPPRPIKEGPSDDRHGSPSNYWRFLTEAWAGISLLLGKEAHIVIRMGGKKLTHDEALRGLTGTLTEGLGRRVSLVEKRTTEISGGRRRSFRPGAEGTKVEHDFHFAVLRV
jgi:hypothetical protein